MSSSVVLGVTSLDLRSPDEEYSSTANKHITHGNLGVVYKDAKHQTSKDVQPRVVDMKQGSKISPLFSAQEFQTRFSVLRTYMEENGIGAVVFTSYQNICYYSGFMYTGFGRQYGVVVTKSDTCVVAAAVDGGQPWRRSPGVDKIVTYTDWYKDNFYHTVSQILTETEGDIGLEFDHVTLDSKVKFDQAMTHSKVDISKPTMRLRMRKSPEEIAIIKKGARIAELGAAAAIGALHEGATEIQVADASTIAMKKEIGNTYPDAEFMDTWTWCQSGINTDGAHNPVTSKKIQKGDIISLNCFPLVAGYYAAIERTLFCGQPSEEHLRIWKINCEVHKRGCELIRPGVKCSDIALELNQIFEKYGVLKYKTIGYGHAIGIICHYYGREAELELREDIHTVLQPGMVLSMEPMLVIPEGMPGAGGYREHDILIVTETGAENITKFPYGPEHNIILDH